jgi:hypothetical protein
MGILETIALSMGIAWASGINLYAAVATLGLLGATGHMTLPPELQILQDPAVIAAAGFMYCVEFFADKVPGVDSAWDAVHSFIRIPAGAVLAAMAVGDVSPAAELAALIVGGGLAAASHGLKSGGRILINSSPEPVSNWTASVGEDVIVVAGLTAAVFSPGAFLVALGVFLLAAIWLMPKIWRAIKALFAALARAFGGGKARATDAAPAALFDPKLLSSRQGAIEPPR